MLGAFFAKHTVGVIGIIEMTNPAIGIVGNDYDWQKLWMGF